MAKKSAAFEANMKRLEEIVELLESGEAGLESSVELFEEGMKISQALSQTLKEVKLRISVLQKDAEGGAKLEPFKQ